MNNGSCPRCAIFPTYSELTDALDSELRETRGLPVPWYDVLCQLALVPGY